MIDNQKYEESFHSFVFFINSSSGSKVGQMFCSIKEKVSLQINIQKDLNSNIKCQDIKKVDLYFYQMKTNRHFGFKLIQTLINQKRKVTTVICGGDGTVTWVISELANYEIDQEKVPFTIIPFGTGNDFSQNLGWGIQKSSLIQNNFQYLKIMVAQWLHAKQDYVDIWEVQAEVQPWGKFQKIVKQESQQLQQRNIKRLFVNYCSFGLDGKVGYSFDIRRTSSRIGNLLIYSVMGAIKGLTKTKNVYQLVKHIKFKPQKKQTKILNQGRLNLNIQQVSPQEVIYQANIENPLQFQYNSNILALNINSYMGGVKDIWKKSKDRVGTQYDSSCSYSDGKLQLVSFSSPITIGLQKVVGGFAQKVYQGKGQIQIIFKQYDKSQKHRTYLQFDGEYLRFSHPSKIIFRQSNVLPKKQFKVLVNSKNTTSCFF